MTFDQALQLVIDICMNKADDMEFCAGESGDGGEYQLREATQMLKEYLWSIERENERKDTA